MTASLHLLYVHSTKLGYARYGVKLAAALQGLGVEIDDHLDRHHQHPAPVTCWVTVPNHALGWFSGQHSVISTMWEAETLPESFRENLDSFDQILVPSEQNLELFSRYHRNVTKVPLGVDSGEWAYRKRMPPESTFRFMIGGSGSRKGTDLAYEAFRKVFPEGSWGDGPIPTIVFKSPRPIPWAGPRIQHVGGFLTDEHERDLYAAAHCYLQPSRGEGWGLQPLQAIAQGCPTILTDAHGQHEFAHLGYGLSYTMAKSDYFIYGHAGNWWEPSLDDLCEYMEYVYNNYDEACDFAQLASQACHRDFTWERTAERFVEAVGPDRLAAPYSGDGTWVEPVHRRYLVRVVRPWRAEVAQTVYQFQPGRDYYELADVKRILFELGDVLDPSCLVTDTSGPPTEIETGLAPEQIARIPDYSASMSYCWHCGQKLGTGQPYIPEFDD